MPDVIISPIHVRLLVFTATVPRRGSPLREWFLEENVALGARWKEPPRTTQRSRIIWAAARNTSGSHPQINTTQARN
jgi:hypothetical protein